MSSLKNGIKSLVVKNNVMKHFYLKVFNGFKKYLLLTEYISTIQHITVTDSMNREEKRSGAQNREDKGENKKQCINKRTAMS